MALSFHRAGQVRSRRGGFGRSAISLIAGRAALSSFRGGETSFRGGESRLPGNLAADNAECSDERYPIRVEIGLVCGFAHQVPYPVVGQQESPDFLLDQFRFP